MLRHTLSARFSDAQCGFKAIRREIAVRLLPRVEDDGWFLDTELLVLAERSGLRIHEVLPDLRCQGWQIYGGTSASAPIIASVYALAGNPRPTDSANSYPYAHTSDLNDVTSGNNGTCGAPLCTASASYDGPTGLGTPQSTSAFASAAAVSVANPGARTDTTGTPTSLQMSASGGTAPYTWAAISLPPGLTINSTSGLISGTPTTAGSFAVTVTAKDIANTTGSTSFQLDDYRRVQHDAHILRQPVHVRPAGDVHRRRVLARRHADRERDV
jgi:hypothetical protein